MRVYGDHIPKNILVEKLLNGKVEIRITENIKPIVDEKEEKEDTETEQIQQVLGYQYDEYTFVVDDKENLQTEIETNLQEWLTSGRTKEINTQATLFVNAKAQAIDEYTETLIDGGLI